MIVVSPALVITPADDTPATYPFIGWLNLATIDNIVAEHEAADFPASNLANTSTALLWKSDDTGEQLVTITGLEGETDYIGIARHNFGTGSITVSVEGITAETDPTWVDVFEGALPADDSPLILVFARDFYTSLRVRLVPDAVAPQAAVLFAGLGLRVERGVQPGMTPIVDGRDVDLVNGRSESGEHLGAIVTGSALGTSVEFKALSPDWYRTTMRPFVDAANDGAPFFFAWNPAEHPDEVGYCWLNGPALPVIAYMGGREIDLSLDLGGLAL